MKINVLIFNVPKPETNLKEVRVRIDMAFVGGSCNEECIMNLDLKYEIKKLSGWEKHTYGDTGDTEKSPELSW